MTAALDPISPTQLSLSGPQSITDYPLRNLSLLAFGSLAMLLLARFGKEPTERYQEVLP